MKNDKNYAHSWLQNTIGWVIGLMDIISKIWRGGCYVTSALVQHKGFDDNCEIMQKIRLFRKEHIINNNVPEKINDLERYYFEGQILVRWIEARHDADLIWNYVDTYIRTFVKMIDNKRYNEAYILFKNKTLNLQKDVFLGKHEK